MVNSDEPPALAYIEKTLSESYRKEIDQEENVWRSLPFFAATLALQLAALFQMIDKLPIRSALAGQISLTFLGLAGLLTLVSLGFVAASIYPQKFEYIAQEPDLLAYAQTLIDREHSTRNLPDAQQVTALPTLKAELARQYANGAYHNRRINKRRGRLRSIAGLAALGSVLMTVFLVAATYTHYVIGQSLKEPCDAAVQAIRSGDPAAQARPYAFRDTI